jgi:hypothetical protein
MMTVCKYMNSKTTRSLIVECGVDISAGDAVLSTAPDSVETVRRQSVIKGQSNAPLPVELFDYSVMPTRGHG